MPWLFGLFLTGLLILLALVLSVARMKFVGVDELPGPAPTQHGSQIDHSFPFLESLNEVLETNRVEESQSHVHRMYFMGPNTFSEPWHLPHTPPEQIQDIVYEGAFNTFVDEINGIAAYQWWEGAIHSILSVVGYPLACSWQQCRRRLKLQRLREFVRSEYDHACLRSCRSRALYEGIKVNATANLMLAYMDFFLGGDEKRTDLPPLNLIHYNWGLNLVRNFDDGGVGVVDLLCSSGEHDDAGRVRNGERSMLFTDSGSFTTSHDDDDDDDDSDAGGERGCSCSGSGVVHELVHNVVSINGWLRRFFSSWQKGDVLGKGSFGTVYEGFTEIFFLSQKRRMLRRKLLILVYLILLGQMKICCWYFPLAH